MLVETHSRVDPLEAGVVPERIPLVPVREDDEERTSLFERLLEPIHRLLNLPQAKVDHRKSARRYVFDSFQLPQFIQESKGIGDIPRPGMGVSQAGQQS